MKQNLNKTIKFKDIFEVKETVGKIIAYSEIDSTYCVQLDKDTPFGWNRNPKSLIMTYPDIIFADDFKYNKEDNIKFWVVLKSEIVSN